MALQGRSSAAGGHPYFYDQGYSPTPGRGVWAHSPILAALCDPMGFHLFRDHFYTLNYVATTGQWVVTKDGAVLASVIDRAGGWAQAITDVNDNDEMYVASLGESWLFAAGKPLWFEARVELTEANVDDANLIVGLSDANGADTLVNNGGGPPASYSGAVWFKVDGGTVWQFESSNAGTQVTTTNAGAFVSATPYRVGFIFDPGAGTTGTITPYLNGVAGTAQSITLASLTEMNFVWGVKAGGAAAAETLKIDAVQILQVL